MKFLTLIAMFLLAGCATFNKDYSRFKEAVMCMNGPTTMFRDADLNVCWFVANNNIVTVDCDTLNRMKYCNVPVQPQAKAKENSDDKTEKPAPAPAPSK